MDPDACFSALFDAIASNDRCDAYTHAEDLLHWLDCGGFAPGGGKLRRSAIRDFCTWVKSQYPMEE
jgi:hypothetical protein